MIVQGTANGTWDKNLPSTQKVTCTRTLSLRVNQIWSVTNWLGNGSRKMVRGEGLSVPRN